MLNDIIINWSPLTIFCLYLHFLTFLIKLILWLKFSTDKRLVEGMGDCARIIASCCFNITTSIFCIIYDFI